MVTDMTSSRPLALITGASSGIGLELARQFAEHDFDLFVCAEDDGLLAAAGQLRSLGVDVRMLQSDLRTAQGVDELYAAVVANGRPLDAAALNAGVGRGGAFVSTDLSDELDIIDLNVRGTVQLAKLVLSDMTARNSGRVLFTSSIASTMPGSYQAVYNASKSFVQSFAEALQNELKDTAVTVTSLMPGPTETNFFRRALMEHTPVGRRKKEDSTQVARQGFEALMAGTPKVVGGSFFTKAQTAAAAVLPDAAKAQLHRLMAKPQKK